MPAVAAQPSPCPHCGTMVEGPEGTFCCHGCEAAAAILADAGLQGWYVQRDQPAPRPGGDPGIAWDAVPTTAHPDGTCSLELTVGGLRCASCVWVTEKLLERTDGVLQAHVSYATGHAEVRFDPGRVQVATLAGRIAGLGYTPRPGGSHAALDRDLLLRLGVATFGALNVMGMSVAVYAGWIDGMEARWAQLFRWCTLLLATPVVTWSAAPFFQGAWRALRHRLLHMDLPVALAVGLLYAHGLVATLRHADGYLDSVTMLVALLLAGRVLEARGRGRAVEAATALAAAVPRTARRVTGRGVEVVPSSALQPGDAVELGLGDELPADGVVVAGRGAVRMALLTGESRPVPVAPGDALVAGAVVEEGSLRLGITRVGDATLVARMAADLVRAAGAPREPSAADRLAPAFTAGTLTVALLTFAAVAVSSGLDAAVARTAAVLVVACPCALALAVPLVGTAGIGALARRGLLVRDLGTLERLARVDRVVLDKTGTLTGGRPEVVEAPDEALRLAAGLERSSRHPAAHAVLEAAVARGIALPSAVDVVERPGVGIDGRVDGRVVQVRAAPGGGLRVLADGQEVGRIALADRPRPDAAASVEALRQLGVEVELLSGDDEAIVDEVGRALGADRAAGRQLPADKVAHVEALAAAGHHVLFVGDGLNDAPALAAAEVGVAMASGAAPSVLAAHAVLASERLGPIAAALVVAPVVQRRVRLALLRSVVYNVVAVAAAVAGWIDPLVAAVLMPLSSGLVLLTAATVEGRVARATTLQESP
ncbi:MAG: heavy metal translocating P-type ATPase metal-binding domain-containing protein [Alphaproteobacteria bacterium]|nr:heavy metal translocating P-type ATPase metal-binding domain-containing protein [Alphaproteobacteria bacterium]